MSAIDWATVNTDLPPLIKTLTGLECEWRGQEQCVFADAWAKVDILDMSTIGVDDILWANVPNGVNPIEEVTATIQGQRELTLQVSVWSERQDLSQSARFYLERLRTRMRYPSTVEAFAAMGLCLVRLEDTVNIDQVEDGRLRSLAALDMRFAYLVSETDAAQPIIDRVHVTSNEYENPAGIALHSNLQIDQDLTEP